MLALPPVFFVIHCYPLINRNFTLLLYVVCTGTCNYKVFKKQYKAFFDVKLKLIKTDLALERYLSRFFPRF